MAQRLTPASRDAALRRATGITVGLTVAATAATVGLGAVIAAATPEPGTGTTDYADPSTPEPPVDVRDGADTPKPPLNRPESSTGDEQTTSGGS